jgi:chemotaxis signal transduction protein
METRNHNLSQQEDTSAESPRIVPDSKLRDIVPFMAGDRVFAIFASHVDCTAEAKLPAPLPRATSAVLGVVCVRGRMLTVLDPVALVTGHALTWTKGLPSVIALGGDEQLALAAETCRDQITIDDADIERTSEDDEGGPAIGLIRYAGEEITILNPERLFRSAMHRRERRRRRF